jgi:hypothetical protein
MHFYAVNYRNRSFSAFLQYRYLSLNKEEIFPLLKREKRVVLFGLGEGEGVRGLGWGGGGGWGGGMCP